jgi:hypothetical protein
MSRSSQHAKAAERIEDIRRRIAAVEHVCSGTLSRRMMTCGRPACRCARERAARHGPYFEWGRLVRGRLAHRWLSADEARRFTAAIKGYREIRRLLRAWERESVTLLEDPDEPKD